MAFDKIFDADMHMSPYKNDALSIDAPELAKRMENAGIGKCLVWLMPQLVSDVSESNKYIYDMAKRYPQFAAPFGWCNIREGEEKAIADAKTCLLEYGFKGVKLNGAQNEYFIDSEPALHACEVIAKNKGIIGFHIGTDEPEYTDPVRAARVAQMFPETPILMIHMGGVLEPYASAEVIDAAKANPNMMLIGSAIHVSKVKEAIDALGAHRVMFGSDVPFADASAHLAAYEEMLKDYPQEMQDKVMFQNALDLFGLTW